MTVTDYYVTTDAMGSVMAVLDETGNVLERRSYDAFGEATYMLPDGTVVPDSPTGVDIGFQGQLMDELTGMYQMGYRWYSPVLGRWLSRDPIGLEGGLNSSAAFQNNPTFYTDVRGLDVQPRRLEDKGFVTVHGYIDYEIHVSETCPDVEIQNPEYTPSDSFAEKFLGLFGASVSIGRISISINAYAYIAPKVRIVPISSEYLPCGDCKFKMLKKYEIKLMFKEQFFVFSMLSFSKSVFERDATRSYFLEVFSRCLKKC